MATMVPAKKLRHKRPRGELIQNVFLYVLFAAITIICVFPFYYIFINTISDNDLVVRGLVVWYPKGMHFGNYIEVFKLKALPQATLVTLARTVLGTVLGTVCTAFVGYAVSKKELFHRKFVYRFFVITMYFQAGLLPWFIVFQNLGLTNNFLAYVLPAIISPFNLVLVKTYVESIPPSLEESAEIDGAGYLKVFFRLIIPLCTPILATISVFTAIGQWSSFMDTVMLMTDSRLYTLQFLLWNYLNEANAVAAAIRNMVAAGGQAVVNNSTQLTTTTVKMTISMVVTLPILFVYPFFQRYFVKGIMLGAVKG